MKRTLVMLSVVAVLSIGGIAKQTNACMKANKMEANKLSDFDIHKALYNFQIPDCWKPCGGINDQYLNDFKIMDKNYVKDGEVQFSASVHQVLLKYDGTDDVYAFAYHIVVEPLQVYHPATGMLWWAKPSRGDNWATKEVVTTVDLNSGSFGDWAPKNLPQTTSTSYTLSVGTDGASISATVDYVYQDVEFISKTRPITGYYYSQYTFNNGLADTVTTGGSDLRSLTPPPTSKYATSYYGFFTFQADSIDFYLDVDHKVSFWGTQTFATVSLSFDYDY